MNKKTTVLLISLVLVLAAIWFLRPTKKWDIYTSIGTVGAVVVALFSSELGSFLHSPELSISILKDLESDVGGYWFHGIVRNTGDTAAHKCRIKLLTFESNFDNLQSSKFIDTFLQWRGGIKASIKLNQSESFTFDIVVFSSSIGKFQLISYLGDNELLQTLPDGTYATKLALYGDNFSPVFKTFKFNINNSSRQLQII